MPNTQPSNQPDESLENPMRSRSLGIALGVTELIFIAGLLLLATGLFLVLDWPGVLMAVGFGLIVMAAVNSLQEPA